VVPHLPAFMKRYPGIGVDIVVTDETLNMIEAGIDVAIRVGALPDSLLMARRLAPHRRVVCASPDYFKRHGTPSIPEDLPNHESLRLALQPDDKWFFTRTGTTRTTPEQTLVELKGRFRGDDSEAALQLALADCGIALLPTWLVNTALRDKRLVHALPEWEARTGRAEPAIWAVYPPKKIVSSKVRAFVDFLAEVMGEPPYWDDGLAFERGT
jgi:DNA-binding transcriptional LysR family regulator